jgi:hypothetical protein
MRQPSRYFYRHPVHSLASMPTELPTTNSFYEGDENIP